MSGVSMSATGTIMPIVIQFNDCVCMDVGMLACQHADVLTLG